MRTPMDEATFLEFYKNALEDYIIKKIRKEYF